MITNHIPYKLRLDFLSSLRSDRLQPKPKLDAKAKKSIALMPESIRKEFLEALLAKQLARKVKKNGKKMGNNPNVGRVK